MNASIDGDTGHVAMEEGLCDFSCCLRRKTLNVAFLGELFFCVLVSDTEPALLSFKTPLESLLLLLPLSLLLLLLLPLLMSRFIGFIESFVLVLLS